MDKREKSNLFIGSYVVEFLDWVWFIEVGYSPYSSGMFDNIKTLSFKLKPSVRHLNGRNQGYTIELTVLWEVDCLSQLQDVSTIYTVLNRYRDEIYFHQQACIEQGEQEKV